MTRLDKRKVAESFSKAASTYESVADLQKKIATHLLSTYTSTNVEVLNVLDVGCGTGYFSKILAETFCQSKVVGVDIADGMIAYAQEYYGREQYAQLNLQWCCADAEALPYDEHFSDLVFSSFAFQWCPSLDVALKECYRVLKGQGQLLFSVPGPGTLIELEKSWGSIDSDKHVNQFTGEGLLKQYLEAAGFSKIEFFFETIITTYQSVSELAHELKALGAHNINSGRAKNLTGKATLKRMMSAYEEYRRDDGLLPATYEVIYVKAEK